MVTENSEKFNLVGIEDEMKTSYLDYAMSVIVARALPDVRDGMKPVHRRILYSMYDSGMRSNSSYKKSARVVGDVCLIGTVCVHHVDLPVAVTG